MINVSVKIKTKEQDLMTINGDLYPCITNGKKACTFNCTSTISEFEIEEKIQKAIKDIISKAISEEGYEYFYHNNKDNALNKCPFRNKSLVALIEKNDDAITLDINRKKFNVKA